MWAMTRFIYLIIVLNIVSISSLMADERILFSDDFESGALKWDLVNADKIRIVDSGDSDHKNVMALFPGGQTVYALIKNSQGWTNYKIEGDVFFPEDFHNYMGLIYHYNVRRARTDFGSIYIKGNNSYLRVNPHRDGNASRTLYEEYKTPLIEESAIRIGEWQHFKAEVMGSVCHFYVGDMERPKVTYNFLEFDSGRVGFKPRIYGSECWIDNIEVASISSFHYQGPILPEKIQYSPETLITHWDVIGPFHSRVTEIEQDGFLPDRSHRETQYMRNWESFHADGRGCVVAGRVCGFNNWRRVVYFHCEVHSDQTRDGKLMFSTRNDLTVWVNGVLAGQIKQMDYCWHDFMDNPEHAGDVLMIRLKTGQNQILVLVQGGRYAGDGFYVHVE